MALASYVDHNNLRKTDKMIDDLIAANEADLGAADLGEDSVSGSDNSAPATATASRKRLTVLDKIVATLSDVCDNTARAIGPVANVGNTAERDLHARLAEHIRDAQSPMSGREVPAKYPSLRVEHYAGPVVYTCHDWIDKNAARPNERIHSVLSILKLSFDGLARPEKAKAPGQAGPVKRYRRSLKALLSDMDACDVHVVRCLRLDSSAKPGELDRSLFMSRLEACGIIEIVRRLRDAFSVHMLTDQFLS